MHVGTYKINDFGMEELSWRNEGSKSGWEVGEPRVHLSEEKSLESLGVTNVTVNRDNPSANNVALIPEPTPTNIPKVLNVQLKTAETSKGGWEVGEPQVNFSEDSLGITSVGANQDNLSGNKVDLSLTPTKILKVLNLPCQFSEDVLIHEIHRLMWKDKMVPKPETVALSCKKCEGDVYVEFSSVEAANKAATITDAEVHGRGLVFLLHRPHMALTKLLQVFNLPPIFSEAVLLHEIHRIMWRDKMIVKPETAALSSQQANGEIYVEFVSVESALKAAAIKDAEVGGNTIAFVQQEKIADSEPWINPCSEPLIIPTKFVQIINLRIDFSKVLLHEINRIMWRDEMVPKPEEAAILCCERDEEIVVEFASVDAATKAATISDAEVGGNELILLQVEERALPEFEPNTAAKDSISTSKQCLPISGLLHNSGTEDNEEMVQENNDSMPPNSGFLHNSGIEDNDVIFQDNDDLMPPNSGLLRNSGTEDYEIILQESNDVMPPNFRITNVWDDLTVEYFLNLLIESRQRRKSKVYLDKDWKDISVKIGMTVSECRTKKESLNRTYRTRVKSGTIRSWYLRSKVEQLRKGPSNGPSLNRPSNEGPSDFTDDNETVSDDDGSEGPKLQFVSNKRWTDADRDALVDAWCFVKEDLSKIRKENDLWYPISQKLCHLGHVFSPTQCSGEMTELLKIYKKFVDRDRSTGAGCAVAPGWPYYERINRVLGNSLTVKPKALVAAGSTSRVENSGKNVSSCSGVLTKARPPVGNTTGYKSARALLVDDRRRAVQSLQDITNILSLKYNTKGNGANKKD